MARFFRLCGLNVRSNRQLPGLAEGPASTDPDLEVVLAQGHPWLPASDGDAIPHLYRDRGGDFSLRVWKAADGSFFLEYSDGSTFSVSASGERVWADWREPATFEDTTTYLLGPVLGLVLRCRDVVSLHASSVVVGGGAVAVAGLSGAGKSTLATAFARRGYAVSSDGLVPVIDRGDRFLAQPTFPLIRLWPDTVRRFFGSADALPAFSPRWDKRVLALRSQGLKFERSPRPLRAVFCLESTEVDRPLLTSRPLTGQQALIALIHNSYGNYLLDARMRVWEFDVLSRLAGRVPVRSLEIPPQRPSPEALCNLVLNALEGSGQRQAIGES